MDKKNTTIGVLLLIAAMAVWFFGPKSPQPHPAPQIAQPTSGSPIVTEGDRSGPAPESTFQPGPAASSFSAPARDTGPANIVTLANDFIEVQFSDLGGAIRDVGLKKFPARKGSPELFRFNGNASDPMLAFTRESFPGLDASVRYEVVSQSAQEIVFRTVFENRLEVTRRYVLPGNQSVEGKSDPYQVRHETTFRNLTDQTTPLPRATLRVGAAGPTNDQDFVYLDVGYYDGEDFRAIPRTELDGGGFLTMFGIGSAAPKPALDPIPTNARWVSINTQFFTAIATPDQPVLSVTPRRVSMERSAGLAVPEFGVAGDAQFDLKPLAAGASETLGLNFYVGPKENQRLEQLGKNQERVMQFDRYFFNSIFMSRFISPFLLWLMNQANSWVHNYGVAIIVMTLILKIVFLPFTLAAARSGKRMQKLQPQMQALREKHKDNPQKLNQATIELFKEHKVNPMGGCLPILVTMPFFIGFFVMLQSASELRFMEFLWAKDLSAPDTVARLGPIPINIMPILLGVTMVVQMRLTPQPTTDQMQAKIFKFMPYIFTLFCYNFSCALSLYSTVNGIFTIGQQLVINRMSDTPVPVSPATAAAKTVKNVTPKKKKG